MYKEFGKIEVAVKRNHYRYGLGVSVYLFGHGWDVTVNLIVWTISVSSFGEVEF